MDFHWSISRIFKTHDLDFLSQHNFFMTFTLFKHSVYIEITLTSQSTNVHWSFSLNVPNDTEKANSDSLRHSSFQWTKLKLNQQKQQNMSLPTY